MLVDALLALLPWAGAIAVGGLVRWPSHDPRSRVCGAMRALPKNVLLLSRPSGPGPHSWTLGGGKQLGDSLPHLVKSMRP